MGTPLLWTIFLIAVVVMVTIDLRLSRGKAITARKAAIWTGIWVSLSLSFGGYLFFAYGPNVGVPFLTAYVVEYALSVDNLFVFLVIFGYFKVANQAQFRLLYWGIVGALVLRGTLIFLGTALVNRFDWLLYIFGGFLLYTAYKLLFSGDHEVEPEKSPVLVWARRILPVTSEPHGLAFFAREGTALKVTPLFLVLLVVETSDLLFALDSIPAVLGISQDPFIVFSSNACAILGLRSLYFLVSSLMDKFRYLKVGLALILAFVGVKMVLETWLHHHVEPFKTILVAGSLGFIAVTLTVSVVASVAVKPKGLPPPPKAEVP